MLRIYGKTTWLTAALFVTASFTLHGASRALAQEVATQETQACPDGSDTSGYASNGAQAGVYGGLHHPMIVNCRPQYYGQPELFYNYYMPGTCGGVPAAMYLAPQPVPPLVGHTYYTYQPFMPHELLYPHHRSYYRYYDNGRGLTRTHVSWYRPPLYSWTQYLRIAR
jgi:hypothetical protein